ncbi:MAG: LysM peptidoglycan-binding domain-containing protein [Bacteroidia bacterium]|nr:LysM peptidoglycan-binding domain-containing protein [Bacteroidia bacterium]
MKNVYIIFMFLLPVFISAQEIVRSEQTVSMDGKMYYVHKVEAGQTLYSIAKAYNVSVKMIVDANPDTGTGLQPGQELKVPYIQVPQDPEIVKQEEKSPKWKWHKVLKGETWYSISKKYNLTVEQIKALNAEVKDDLKAGQDIRIPTIGAIKKETVKRNEPVQIKDPVIGTPPSLSDTITIRKEEYKIGFLLPFNLGLTDLIEPEKIKKGTRAFPEKARIAIEFYHGVKMAMDSLQKSGIKVQAYYFDTGSDSAGSKWMKDPELKNMDLLVGPLFTNSFMEGVKLAKQLGITIVSPTLQNNKLLIGNPEVNKASASTYTQMEEIGKYVAANFAEQNIMVVSSGGPKDMTIVNAVRNAGSKVLIGMNKDSMRLVNGLSGVTASLVKEKINVVVLPSNNQSYVTDVLSKLYKLHIDRKDSIIIVGMNAWSSFENLDMEYLNGMAFHYPSNSFVNYTDTGIVHFIHSYRGLYKSEPTDYTFDGFDIALFYGSLLWKEGVKFSPKLEQMTGEGMNMRFRYVRSGTDSGYENTGVFILRYKDYHLIRVN